LPNRIEHAILKNLAPLLRGNAPGQLVVQFTTHCNARCPQCGMRVTEKFQRKRIPTEDLKRIIDAAAARNIGSISFTGGEPLLFLDDLTELVRYAVSVGIPLVRTGTNGFIFANPERNGFRSRVETAAEKLAGASLRNLWISLDSADPSTHEKMRGLPGVVRGLEKGLKYFHDAGLYPSANMGINRNLAGRLTADLRREDFPSGEDYLKVFSERFEKGFERFLNKVVNIGFTMVSFCYPMSVDAESSRGLEAVYAATSTQRVVSFDRKEKACLFDALLRATEPFRSRIRIFTPRCALRALSLQYSENSGRTRAYPCRGGLDFFFVNAEDGLVYPCGYRGGDCLGKLEENRVSKKTDCRLCDWECFRDPSELFGPVTGFLSNPFHIFKKLKSDPEFFRLWFKDLRYNLACDFFDGSKNIDFSKLKDFDLGG
jgi:uncharacterized Fe-S cluster-containing radical SAM superfamily protein